MPPRCISEHNEKSPTPPSTEILVDQKILSGSISSGCVALHGNDTYVPMPKKNGVFAGESSIIFEKLYQEIEMHSTDPMGYMHLPNKSRLTNLHPESSFQFPWKEDLRNDLTASQISFRWQCDWNNQKIEVIHRGYQPSLKFEQRTAKDRYVAKNHLLTQHR
jgi:hypothetical protein